MRYLHMIVDSILPPRCPFSGDIVDSPGMVSAEAWSTLSFITDPVCSACGFPFDFAVPFGGADALCAACLGERPEYSSARSALVYNDVSRDFVLGFKHGDQTHSVAAMVPWLKTAGAGFWHKADMIVPVPLHPWRLLRRRYNQAALMGQAMAAEMNLPFYADLLRRNRATPTQGHLNAGERRNNVRKAFAIHPRKQSHILGKSLILIDDVYTTGSTVRECARTLLNGGAKDVFVLTLARVVRPHRG